MKRVIAISVLIFALGFISLQAPAEMRRFRFQGMLFDVLQDVPLEGERALTLTFKIYDAESGGTKLWEETHDKVSIDNGFVDVELGRYSALDGLLFDKQYWISVEVESDGEMHPRIRLAPVPYTITSEE